MSLERACACGGGATYDACCGPLHRQERCASTAAELMRSRYCGYAVGALDHVFRTWHPRTRPDEIEATPGLTWLGLTILGTEAGGPDDTDGVVEFRAGFRTAAGPGELHERSSFTRRAGRWVYVDGDIYP
ncbi:hypothetical protein EXU48_01325 [Occultella glacieicola]|uniref:UPF0225 protein EXU48_01325 n=1 Tax=Occultella glacieicola TaxID=2518684 RepID=A0ABY2E8N6_9MICO|nr:YchJ family metal-binding protein [Occultella glacieicola]TDE98870.1 hypothetical protein EXU48_01325 [Occultella glacieicola]